ncbi:hypothetical protein F2Q70_00035115 [Brassica cretica]|nr:hypothetical protein F2Q70_00035115 [Brassica cretica]
MMLIVLCREEEPPKRSIDSDNDSEDEAASAVNPMSSDAAHIHPLLQNLLLSNDIQRERLNLIGLIQLYDPTALRRKQMLRYCDMHHGLLFTRLPLPFIMVPKMLAARRTDTALDKEQ